MLDDPNVQATPETTDVPVASTDTPVTPAADVPAIDPATTEFLRANDRTVYKTAEDAIKGINEAQSHIAKLTPFQEICKEYGVTDPQQIRELFNELVDARAAKSAAPAPSQETMARAVAGDPVAFAKLTPEWQTTAKYLRDEAGFVTKDALAPLEQRLSAFEQSQVSADQQRVQSARDNGVTILTGLMKSAGLPTDEESLDYVGSTIVNKISATSYDSKGQLIRGSEEDRFIRGSEADRTKIISDKLQWFSKLREGAAKSANADYVKDKNTAIASTPRPLPPSNSPSSPAKPAVGKGMKDPNLNKIVSELFKSQGKA